jgi:hypothetical protein
MNIIESSWQGSPRCRNRQGLAREEMISTPLLDLSIVRC